MTSLLASTWEDPTFTFCGHSSFHIIGPMLFRPYLHNPPVPIPQLYQYLMKCGKVLTSWRNWVVRLPMCFIIAPQFCRHCVSPGVICNHLPVPFITTCIGENSPAPPGMSNDVCWSLPASFPMTFLGVFVVHFLMLWSWLRILWVFLPVVTVCSPGYWISSLWCFSYALMFRPLCLSSFWILNHPLRAQWIQRAGNWHEFHATCSVIGEEDVLYQYHL